MGVAGAIRAGKAFVELTTNDKTQKGMNAAEKRLRAFGATIGKIGLKLSALGAGVLGPLAAASKVFASMGDTLYEASQRTGVAVEALSALKYAAEQSGAGLDDLERGLRGIGRHFLEAKTGGKEAAATFAHLGLAIAQLEGMSPDERFKLIADRLSKIKDPSLKAALAMKLFGKEATQLIPLLYNGAAGIEALMKRAKELGLVMSGPDSQAADKFSDILKDLWQQAKMVTFHVGAAVAGALQPWLDKATRVGATVIAWVKENRGLVISIGAVAAGVVAAGVVITAFGISLTVTAIALKGIGGAFGFVFSKLGLLTGLLVGGVAAWFYFSDSGKAALSALKRTFSVTMGGIADAMTRGDIQLAARILWTGLQIAFLEGTRALLTIWANFRAAFTKLAVKTFFGALEAWEIASAALQTAMAKADSAILKHFNAAFGVVAKGFGEIQRRMAKEMLIFNISGKVSKDQLAAELRFIDEQYDRQDQIHRNREMDAQTEIDAGLAQRLADVQKQRDAALIALVDREKELTSAADANALQDIENLRRKLEELNKELGKLRESARAVIGSDLLGGMGGLGAIAAGFTRAQLAAMDAANRKKFNPDDFFNGLDAVKSQLDGKQSQGIFNASSIQALQGSKSNDRIVNATEHAAEKADEIARNTERIARNERVYI